MPILGAGGTISRGVSRFKWQGEAQVTVAIVHIVKGACAEPILNGKPVKRISAYLVEGDLDLSPRLLADNMGKAFQGSIVLGTGFTFDDDAAAKGTASSIIDMERLIAKSPNNAERIFPYIGGEEVNNDPRHKHHRYVIDFGQVSEGTVRANWPDLAEVVERLVKPERGSSATVQWWQFERRRDELYNAIRDMKSVLVTNSKAAPQYSIARLPTGMVYTQNLHVFVWQSDAAFAALQSRSHEVWARFFSSTLEDRLAYSLSDSFATFPFPPGFETDAALEAAGQVYHDYRAQLMSTRNEGLTKTYNRFHDRNEKSADLVRLRGLHDAMDLAVLTAYGWDDLASRIASDPYAMIQHLTEEDEADHKYQGRYFWPVAMRDEVLARLLALNAMRAEEERRAGLEPVEADDEGDEPDDEDEEAA